MIHLPPRYPARMSEPLGIIAGKGRLPVVIAEGMRAQGHEVCGVGLYGHYDPELPGLCDHFAVAGVLQIGRWLKLCKRFGAAQAVLVGTVEKSRMHDPLRLFRQIPDWRTMDIWYRRIRHDKRSSMLLRTIAEEMQRSGVELIDSTKHIPDHLALEGVMTRTRVPYPTDITFGWSILRKSVELEIGQAITVRERDVIAVEAVEGTDRLIERTTDLCPRGGWALLKTASENHDMRTDVPTIGLNTISMLKKHGAKCLAVGAGRVIIIDRNLVIDAADRAGIAIVGIGPDGPEAALERTARNTGA